MTKKLFLLAVVAAAAFAPDQPELPAGFTFLAPDEVADKLLADGTARLATDDDPLSSDPTPAAAAPVKSDKPVKKTRVRLLGDGPHGKANDVVELPAPVAKQLTDDGQADAGKEAIAYALTLPQNQPLA